MELKGFVNINKPLEMTSSDVVVIVRGILRRTTGEKQKVGHLGTLDPNATGVLPIAIGKATRLFDFALNKQKKYVAEFTFGRTTDTLDYARNFVEQNDKIPTLDEVIAVSKLQIGNISQLPPIYSAKSINGQRAYDLARDGKLDILEKGLKPKNVQIFSINVLEQKTLFNHNDTFELEIQCSSGTYIRSIARDIGKSLNKLCFMSKLNRIESGEFNLNNSVTLEQFQINPLQNILPTEILLQQLPKLNIDNFENAKVQNGISIPLPQSNYPDGTYKIFLNNQLLSLGEVNSAMLKLTTRL